MADLTDLLSLEAGDVVTIGGIDFTLTAATTATTTFLTASYGNVGEETLNLLDFLGDLSASLAPTESLVPTDLSLNVALSQVLLVVMQPTSGSAKALLAFDLGISFDFVADLPVIGTALSSNDDALAGSFQLLAASADFDEGEVETIADAVGSGSQTTAVSGGFSV